VSRYPEQRVSYDNLLYSCTTCNEAKGAAVIADPCRVLLSGDVEIGADGVMNARTREARRLARVLGLDHPRMTEFRRLWIGIVALAKRFDHPLYLRLMGFPENLPNLARLRPPKGNTRPEGIAACAFSRRQKGTLPETADPQ
jgi:hypothetical protein